MPRARSTSRRRSTVTAGGALTLTCSYGLSSGRDMLLSAALGEQRGDVHEDAVVLDELASPVDRHHGERDRRVVVARVCDVGLHDRRRGRLPLLDDRVRDAGDAGAEAGPRVAYGLAPHDRVGVPEAERHVLAEVIGEAVWLHRVDVGEQRAAGRHTDLL